MSGFACWAHGHLAGQHTADEASTVVSTCSSHWCKDCGVTGCCRMGTSARGALALLLLRWARLLLLQDSCCDNQTQPKHLQHQHQHQSMLHIACELPCRNISPCNCWLLDSAIPAELLLMPSSLLQLPASQALGVHLARALAGTDKLVVAILRGLLQANPAHVAITTFCGLHTRNNAAVGPGKCELDLAAAKLWAQAPATAAQTLTMFRSPFASLDPQGCRGLQSTAG
jgi:hypothetical protein